MGSELKSEISMMRREKKRLWPWTVRKEVRFLAGQVTKENGWLYAGKKSKAQFQEDGRIYIYLKFFERNIFADSDRDVPGLTIKLTLAEWSLLKKKFKLEYKRDTPEDVLELFMLRVEENEKKMKELKNAKQK